MQRKTWFHWLITVCIVGYLSLFFFSRTNLIISDLGRHIMNGKIIWLTAAERVSGPSIFENIPSDGVGNGSPEEWQDALQRSVFSTNMYSYTNPDFTFINHHWLFGVYSYAVYRIGGFSLLTFLNAVLVCCAVVLLMRTAAQKSSWQSTWAASAILLPLLAQRTEVRPETFSVLFGVLYLAVFEHTKRTKKPIWHIAPVILILQLIWVNTHVFFLLGLGIIGMYWLEAVVQHKRQQWSLFALGICATAVALCNPNGVSGALVPLTMFNNYDFLVAENQNTFFMLRVASEPTEHWYFIIVLSILGCVGGIAIATKLRQVAAEFTKPSVMQISTASRNLLAQHGVQFVYVAILAVAALEVNRLYSFFAVLTLPVIAQLLQYVWRYFKPYVTNTAQSPFFLSVSSIVGFGLLLAIGMSGLFVPPLHLFGLGLVPHNLDAASFFSQAPTSAPVLNNYDIGGYLIFTAFPHRRVFTDNRPEAYPPGFFTTFKEAQAQPEAWNTLLAQYGFHAIFFHRLDMTDHGQEFLIRRLQDSLWAPVFVDENTLMLVDRSTVPEDWLARTELPNDLFQYSPLE